MLRTYLQLIETPEEKSEFETFYYKYRKLMYYIAYNIIKDEHLAEDIVSETFMRLAKNFKYIRTLGDITSPQIKRYIVVSVKHNSFNMIKKDRRDIEISLDECDYERVSDEFETLDKIVDNESVENIKRAIDELPEIYKEVMQLIVIFENNVDEVANILEINKTTVYKRVQRARKMIEDALEVKL